MSIQFGLSMVYRNSICIVTSVRCHSDEQFLWIFLGHFDFGNRIESCRTFTVRTGLFQFTFGSWVSVNTKFDQFFFSNIWMHVKTNEWHQTHFAADTIFIDCVIFWMFFTDLSRIWMAFNVAILRFCCANAPFEMIAFTAGLVRCIHMID